MPNVRSELFKLKTPPFDLHWTDVFEWQTKRLQFEIKISVNRIIALLLFV